MDLLVFFQAQARGGGLRMGELKEAFALQATAEAAEKTRLVLKGWMKDYTVDLDIPLAAFQNLRQQKFANARILNIANQETKAYVEQLHRYDVSPSKWPHRDGYDLPISFIFNSKTLGEGGPASQELTGQITAAEPFVMRHAGSDGRVQYGVRLFDETVEHAHSGEWQQGDMHEIAKVFNNMLKHGGALDVRTVKPLEMAQPSSPQIPAA
ncbi:MAG: hypothetical protein KDJ35_06785 [Alphaproteobacteria bacterium]|nr:hypothetical protein [Alphaproteobacteria bacterium]